MNKETIFASNIFLQIPVLMGLCKDDGMIVSAPYFKGPERWKLLREDWRLWAPIIFLGRERENIRDVDREAADDIAQFYFGQTDLNNIEQTPATLNTLTKVEIDSM